MIENQTFQNILVNSLISDTEAGIHSWLNMCCHVAPLQIPEVAKSSAQKLRNDCMTQKARPNIHRHSFLLNKCKHFVCFHCRKSWKSSLRLREALQWLRLVKLGLPREKRMPGQAVCDIVEVIIPGEQQKYNCRADRWSENIPFSRLSSILHQ